MADQWLIDEVEKMEKRVPPPPYDLQDLLSFILVEGGNLRRLDGDILEHGCGMQVNVLEHETSVRRTFWLHGNVPRHKQGEAASVSIGVREGGIVCESGSDWQARVTRLRFTQPSWTAFVESWGGEWGGELGPSSEVAGHLLNIFAADVLPLWPEGIEYRSQ